jgi:[calcium/calmodulin-dependent protein kinase] kinase
MFETSEGYDPFLSDMWSLGVCLFTFIFEKMPFFSADLSEIEIDIKSKNEPLIFPEPISELLENVLKKLLDKNPKERGTIDQFLKCDWMHN